MERFTWRGEPIEDIDQWAATRGERMVSYVATRQVPNMLTGRIETERQTGRMPESFWNGLLMTAGWHYREA